MRNARTIRIVLTAHVRPGDSRTTEKLVRGIEDDLLPILRGIRTLSQLHVTGHVSPVPEDAVNVEITDREAVALHAVMHAALEENRTDWLLDEYGISHVSPLNSFIIELSSKTEAQRQDPS
jgi:hypothetical protein